jgi:hypothetical protein
MAPVCSTTIEKYGKRRNAHVYEASAKSGLNVKELIYLTARKVLGDSC